MKLQGNYKELFCTVLYHSVVISEEQYVQCTTAKQTVYIYICAMVQQDCGSKNDLYSKFCFMFYDNIVQY